MKQLLPLLLIFLTTTTFGQKSRQENKISIGYIFSPDYSFRTIKNGDGNSTTDLVIKIKDEIEEAKFGFTTGFYVIFHMSGVVGLETGILYSNKGYKTKEQDLLNIPIDPSLPNKASLNYSYQYMGIPLKARFTFGKDKIRFTTSAGLMTNFLTGAKETAYYKYADGKTKKKNQYSTSGYNKIEVSPMAGIGLDFLLTDKLHFTTGPTFRYGLSKVQNKPVQEKLWSTGLVFGIIYDLK